MSAMFGAPVGIGAAEQDLREVVQGGLQAQKALGEIEAQPGERALKEAQTRVYTAEASLKESQVADAEVMANLAKGLAASKKAAGAGLVLPAEVVLGGKRPSAADHLEELYQYGVDQGVSPTRLAAMAKQAADIRQKEASAASGESTAKLNELKGKAARAEQIAQMAQSGLQGQQQYDAMRMAMANAGMPVDRLPQTWQEARPQLQAMIAQGMKVRDFAKLEIDQEELKAKKPLWAAQTSRANAGVALAKARHSLAKQEYDLKVKYEGENSAGALAAKRSMEQRRDAITFKEMDATYLPAPLDPSNWKENQAYRIGDKFFIARRQGGVGGFGGTMGGELVTDVPEAYRKLAAKTPAQRAAPMATSQMEEEDEEEED